MTTRSPHTFLGHPRGLATLFFTELWERFSYYGMRAILLLYMIAPPSAGGLGMDEVEAGAIYGLYTMLVYLMALPGGWLADNLLGLRRAVLYGGVLIAIGHIMMVIPSHAFFFFGLVLIVFGTGLLKPNISSMVGELYPQTEVTKRDAAFAIFYMGINLGAFVAPFVTGYLGETIEWHYGFASAGVGMLVGLIYFKLTAHHLAGIGDLKGNPAPSRLRAIRWGLAAVLLLIMVGLVAVMGGVWVLDVVQIAHGSVVVISVCVVIYFIYLLFFAKLTSDERRRVAIIAILFVFSTIFYVGYEQQGSSLTLFGERYTNREVFGFTFPASWFQSAPAIFVILLAPLFTWGWLQLNRTSERVSLFQKFALGLLFMGMGFLVVAGGAYVYAQGKLAGAGWLILTYAFHTMGEICLYPVGLSTVTVLSPKRLVGQLMGIWFMSLALGNLLAGLYAGQFQAARIEADPKILVELFLYVAALLLLAGGLILVFQKYMQRLSKRNEVG